MPIIEQTREYRVYLAEKNFKQSINKTTHQLLLMLNIDPYGCGLVLLVGTPNDRTNADAIRTWVRKALCCPSCMRTKSIRKLASRLERELTEKIQNFYE